MKKLKKTLINGTINAIGLMIGMVSPVHAVRLAQTEPVKPADAPSGVGGFVSNIIDNIRNEASPDSSSGVSSDPSSGTSVPRDMPETSVFGTIEAPEGVKQYNVEAGVDGLGLILFISNIIKLATVVAGIWVMINFILAGWDYIMGAGDSKSVTSASDKMTNSMIGLLIIVSAYTIAGLIGVVFFGDASYIINPKIQGI